MKVLAHKSSKTKYSNQGSTSNCATDLQYYLEVEENINEGCIQMEKSTQSIHRNCRKSPRSSKEEKQAMVEGENLESNRPTTDDP